MGSEMNCMQSSEVTAAKVFFLLLFYQYPSNNLIKTTPAAQIEVSRL